MMLNKVLDKRRRPRPAVTNDELRKEIVAGNSAAVIELKRRERRYAAGVVVRI